MEIIQAGLFKFAVFHVEGSKHITVIEPKPIDEKQTVPFLVSQAIWDYYVKINNRLPTAVSKRTICRLFDSKKYQFLIIIQ